MTARIAILGLLLVSVGCASYSAPATGGAKINGVRGGHIAPTASLVPIDSGFCVTDMTPRDAFEAHGTPTPSIYVDPGYIVDDVILAYVTADNRGKPAIAVQFTDAGSKQLENITRRNLGRALTVYVDGKVVAATQIQSVITDGMAVIQGTFTEAQAQQIADLISRW
ncbi:MAG: hypothetical protein AAF581_12135 [Planctomycetota bacterium]